MYFRLILAMTLVFVLSGCDRQPTLIMDQESYDTIVQTMFDPSVYFHHTHGSGKGPDGGSFDTMIGPGESTEPPAFDFTPFDTYLKSKDTFWGTGTSSDGNLYREQTWDNSERYIIVQGAWLKDGNILITYREIAR